MNEKENGRDKRKDTRHKADFKSSVDALIYDGDTYPLFNPISVNVVEISKSGIRFNAPSNTFTVGDNFTMQIKLNENDKSFTALVVNITTKDDDDCEYGCLLTDRPKET